MRKYNKIIKWLLLLSVMICFIGMTISCGNETTYTSQTTTSIETEKIDYLYEIENEGIKIIDYIGTNECVEIPEEIIDSNRTYPVRSIGSYAFKDKAERQIKKIILPKNLECLGDYSLSSCSELEEIEFSGTNIKKIGMHILDNSPKVKEFKILAGLKDISVDAFVNSNIEKFIINCPDELLWENNILVLISRNVGYSVAIYVNPNATNIICPDCVGILKDSLFEGNQNIKSIDLKNVLYIGDDCFLNSSLENVYYNEHFEINAKASQFYKCPFYNNNDVVTVGTSLIKYNVSEDVMVIPNNVCKIDSFGPDAHAKALVFLDNVKGFSAAGLATLNGLEEIVFNTTRVPFCYDGVIPEDIKLYVRRDMYTRYTSDNWLNNPLDEYIDRFEVKKINVTYLDADGNVYLDNQTLELGQTLSEIVVPEILNDKKFAYYLDQNGNKIEKYSLIESYEDLILTPVYL